MFVKKYFNQGLGSLGNPCHDKHASSMEGEKKKRFNWVKLWSLITIWMKN